MFKMPFSFNVAGVTFKNTDGTNRQDISAGLTTGDFLELQDCASEKYPEAIGVFTQDYVQIGFVPASTAKRLRAAYPAFETLACVVCSVGASDSSEVGVIAEVAETIDEAYDAMPPERAQEAKQHLQDMLVASERERVESERRLAEVTQQAEQKKPAKAAKAAKPKRRGKLRWILILIALFILFLIIAPKK